VSKSRQKVTQTVTNAAITLIVLLLMSVTAVGAQQKYSYATPAGGNTVQILEALGELYSEEYDDAVWEFEAVGGGWDGLVERLTVGAMGGVVPDVARIADIHRSAFVDSELIMDLTSLMENDPLDKSNYFPGVFDVWTVDGKLYGVPTGVLSFAMHINKDLFAERGLAIPSLDWETTWTMDEYREIARKLTYGPEDNPVYGAGSVWTINYLIQWVWSFGGDFVDESGTRCALNSPEAIEALEFVHDMTFVDGSFVPASVSAGRKFGNGELGTYMNGTWTTDSLIRTPPGFNWGVVPLPRGRQLSSGMYIDAWVIPAGASNPEESWKFLKFLAGERAENHLVDNNTYGMPFHVGVAMDRMEDMFVSLAPEEKRVWFDAPNYASYMRWPVQWDAVRAAMDPFWRSWTENQISTTEMANQVCSAINPLL